ncbi:MAG: uracil-DNA glycosylase, partial [Parachlamydiales bacterium]
MNSKIFSTDSSPPSQEELWKNLFQEILNCKKCPLWKTRSKTLIGEGPIDAKTVFIGEAPGYYEDLEGKAFIGQAGKILDQLLLSVKLSRKDIYITNVLKCHPPQNHDPVPEEIKSCSVYLYRQLKLIQPKIIVALGKFAAQELFLKTHLPFSKISEVHGKVFEITASYGKVKIIPLYHPSAACHNPK